VNNLEVEGIKTVFADPKILKKTKIQTIFPSQDANYVILDKDIIKKSRGKKVGRRFKVSSNKDIEKILDSAKKGLDFVIMQVKDWKIIPLENIIAKLHKLHTQIFAIASNPKEARKMFSILDVGVDAVIFNTGSMNAVREALVYLGSKSFDLSAAKIIDIQEVGDGERVCIDTASMILAALRSKLFEPKYTNASLTSFIEPVLKITASTPTSKIENIFLASFGLLAIAKILVCDRCNFAIIFSNGIIFQSFTSITTKSNPFFAESRIFSISLFVNTLNRLPIFFPFDFLVTFFSIT
jgi:hypothetical protein